MVYIIVYIVVFRWCIFTSHFFGQVTVKEQKSHGAKVVYIRKPSSECSCHVYRGMTRSSGIEHVCVFVIEEWKNMSIVYITETY